MIPLPADLSQRPFREQVRFMMHWVRVHENRERGGLNTTHKWIEEVLVPHFTVNGEIGRTDIDAFNTMIDELSKEEKLGRYAEDK